MQPWICVPAVLFPFVVFLLTCLGSHLLIEMKDYEVNILENPEMGRALKEELEWLCIVPLLVPSCVTLGSHLTPSTSVKTEVYLYNEGNFSYLYVSVLLRGPNGE